MNEANRLPALCPRIGAADNSLPRRVFLQSAAMAGATALADGAISRLLAADDADASQATAPVGRIRGLRRLEETVLRLGGKGDNWHMTWAADDKQYVSLCDGDGWEGMPRKAYNSRAYAITGDPPKVGFEYLSGYPDLINNWPTAQSSRYYNFGILAQGSQIMQFLSTPNRPFHQPNPRFVGAKRWRNDSPLGTGTR